MITKKSLNNKVTKSQSYKVTSKALKFLLFICTFAFLLFGFYFVCYAADMKEGPIIVNGDTVEYLTDSKEVSAQGNVSVVYKGAKLTCDKLSVNTQTKDASAEGNVKLDDPKLGIIEGPKMSYNFETKKGTIIDAGFKANPYFGKAKRLEKVSDKEFVAYQCYASTCNYNHPHYRFQTSKMSMFPGDKIQTRDNRFYLGDIPLFYLPFYNHSLKGPLMHVQVSPGQRKEWGGYVLSAWRYNLNEYINGMAYLDYRQKLGLAEGFGVNYNAKYFGTGDLKVYYTEEKPENRSIGEPSEYNRYLVRLKHIWNIDSRTIFTTEYYKIYDEKRKFAPTTDGLLKEYFYREYEKEIQPLSYILMQRYFDYSSLSILMQKRTNHWFDYIEKSPEVKFSLPAYKIGNTAFYFSNESAFANFDEKGNAVNNELKVSRFDTLNKLFIPARISFLRIAPFVAERGTFYDTASNSPNSIKRAAFSAGIETSTKFYRIFDIKTNFLGMGIQGLRHVISPSIVYNYDHKPTVNRSIIKQIDAIDALAADRSAYIELSNKLQTKRDGATIDLLDFLVTTEYYFNSINTATNTKLTDEFSDIFLKLKLIPCAWLRVDFDATYKRSGSHSDLDYRHFSDVNYDINFNLGNERSLGVGQRYNRSGSNEATAQLNWRINPKWKFGIYGRYNAASDMNLERGMQEQQYSLSRDFHCWIVDLNYNISKKDGHTIWFLFKLKAFPETQFGFDQSYHKPNSGAQN